MKGEFINCVYYPNGEYDLNDDFGIIESTLSIDDHLVVEIFVDGVGVGKFGMDHENYDEKLVNIILSDPESRDASAACAELVRSLSLHIITQPCRIYMRG